MARRKNQSWSGEVSVGQVQQAERPMLQRLLLSKVRADSGSSDLPEESLTGWESETLQTECKALCRSLVVNTRKWGSSSRGSFLFLFCFKMGKLTSVYVLVGLSMWRGKPWCRRQCEGCWSGMHTERSWGLRGGGTGLDVCAWWWGGSGVDPELDMGEPLVGSSPNPLPFLREVGSLALCWEGGWRRLWELWGEGGRRNRGLQERKVRGKCGLTPQRLEMVCFK